MFIAEYQVDSFFHVDRCEKTTRFFKILPRPFFYNVELKLNKFEKRKKSHNLLINDNTLLSHKLTLMMQIKID